MDQQDKIAQALIGIQQELARQSQLIEQQTHVVAILAQAVTALTPHASEATMQHVSGALKEAMGQS